MIVNNSNAFSSSGAVIRTARKIKGLNQIDCAHLLDISDKTLRNYEKNGVIHLDFHSRQKIATLLKIEPEQLGLPAYQSYTLEDANNLLVKGEENLELGDFTSAYNIGDTLARSLTRQINDKTSRFLDPLARAHFLAGHAHTIIRENQETSSRAFEHFRKMEETASFLGNDTLLNIALTYQGEMLRRDNKIEAAISKFSAAPQGPLVDVAVRGNLAQLLARAYASQGDIKSFKQQMNRAEDLAFQVQSIKASIYIPYNLGSVYEEYARFYAQRGNIRESTKYIDLTEKNIPQTPRWALLVMMTKGEALLRATINAEQKYPAILQHVNDFQEAIALIGEAAKLAHTYNHQRMLRRAYMLTTSIRHQATKLHSVAQILDDVLAKSTLDEQAMYDEF